MRHEIISTFWPRLRPRSHDSAHVLQKKIRHLKLFPEISREAFEWVETRFLPFRHSNPRVKREAASQKLT